MDHPTAETLAKPLPSKARVGGAEESGRPTRKRGNGEERKTDFLAKKVTSCSKENKGSASKSARKSTREESNQAGKVQGIKKYFEEKAGGLPPNLGKEGKEERRVGSLDPTLVEEPGHITEQEPTGDV